MSAQGKSPFARPELWILLSILAMAGLMAWLDPPERTRAGSGPARVSIDPHPNVVVVIIDTLRADAVGAYGQAQNSSPEIDRLAEGGVRFAEAVGQSSWTRPSFASFLTSQYPRASGITQERLHALPEAFETMAEVFSGAGYVTLGITANPNVNSTFNFDQGFDEYVNAGVRYYWMQEEALPDDRMHGEVPLMSSPQVFRRALALVEEHEGGSPVYLQINVMDPHEDHDPRMVAEDHMIFGDHPWAAYLGALHQVSAALANFMRGLHSRPGFENTLWVIMSDHGEGLDSHPGVARGGDHGFHVYESQTLVPLIFYHSLDGLPHRAVDRPVRLLDMMPTVLELAGVEGPDTMHGTSLVPAMNGEPVELPDRFVVETQFREANAIGVYGDEWAYIEHRAPWGGTDPRELQRRGHDMDGSRTNQIEDHPRIAQELQRYLREWEREHPRQSPTHIGQQLSPVEVEQLRALGYIE